MCVRRPSADVSWKVHTAGHIPRAERIHEPGSSVPRTLPTKSHPSGTDVSSASAGCRYVASRRTQTDTRPPGRRYVPRRIRVIDHERPKSRYASWSSSATFATGGTLRKRQHGSASPAAAHAEHRISSTSPESRTRYPSASRCPRRHLAGNTTTRQPPSSQRYSASPSSMGRSGPL